MLWGVNFGRQVDTAGLLFSSVCRRFTPFCLPSAEVSWHVDDVLIPQTKAVCTLGWSFCFSTHRAAQVPWERVGDAVFRTGVSIMAFELKSLSVQEAETLNPFPKLRKALPESPGNARMEVSVTTSFSTHAAPNVGSLHNKIQVHKAFIANRRLVSRTVSDLSFGDYSSLNMIQ